MIDIVITATVRPELLYTTLKSFYENCFDDYMYENNYKNLNIIINVDPIGDTKKYNQKAVRDVCFSFSDNVLSNMPRKPNFAKAVKWVWEKTTSKYIFHLEDDWLLNRYVKLSKLISYLEDDKLNVDAIKLYKKRYPNNEPYTMFDVDYKYNGDDLFVATDSGTQFGLNPTLIKKSYIDGALPLMVDNLNPEKQFRRKNSKMKNFVLNHRYAIYGIPGDEALIKDTGTSWRNERNIQKPKGSTFLVWK